MGDLSSLAENYNYTFVFLCSVQCNCNTSTRDLLYSRSLVRFRLWFEITMLETLLFFILLHWTSSFAAIIIITAT